MKSNIDDDIYDRWHYNNNKINQSFIDIEDVELPKNTDAGYYYWMGKDYANAYREDFKDIQDFSKGFLNDIKENKILMKLTKKFILIKINLTELRCLECLGEIKQLLLSVKAPEILADILSKDGTNAKLVYLRT